MARWASLIERRRDENPVLLVDTGDFLNDQKHKRFDISNRYLLEGMKRMDYDAIVVGERDIHCGYSKLLDAAKKYDLPLLTTNIFDKRESTLLASPYIIKHVGGKWTLFGRRGGVKIGFFGVVLPYFVHSIDKEITRYYDIRNTKLTALEMVSRLRQEGCNVIVALSHQGWTNSLELAREVPGIDVVINAHRSHETTHSETVDKSLVVDNGDKRRSLTEIRISYKDGRLLTEALDVGIAARKLKRHPHMMELERLYENEMRREDLGRFLGGL
ncbi:MAG: hypothetical protein JSV33_09890 [bacterium]|nr:MAG: hypothetical protein JSV33_09890 [bacterium]